MDLSFSGSVNMPFTDDMLGEYGPSLDQLKKGFQEEWGKTPEDYVLQKPTKNGDHWSQYKDTDKRMSGITATLTPQSAKYVRIYTGDTVLGTSKGINNSPSQTQVFFNIHEDTEETISSSWSKETSTEVSVTVEVGVQDSGYSTSMSKSVTIGKSETVSASKSVGLDHGITVTLEPYQNVDMYLKAVTGKLEVEVEYDVTLSGSMLAYKKGGKKGSHRKTLDIGEVLEGADVENKFTVTQRIEVGLFSDGYFEVHELK